MKARKETFLFAGFAGFVGSAVEAALTAALYQRHGSGERADARDQRRARRYMRDRVQAIHRGDCRYADGRDRSSFRHEGARNSWFRAFSRLEPPLAQGLAAFRASFKNPGKARNCHAYLPPPVLRALTQASLVAPLVSTSSTRRMRAPAILARRFSLMSMSAGDQCATVRAGRSQSAERRGPPGADQPIDAKPDACVKSRHFSAQGPLPD